MNHQTNFETTSYDELIQEYRRRAVLFKENLKKAKETNESAIKSVVLDWIKESPELAGSEYLLGVELLRDAAKAVKFFPEPSVTAILKEHGLKSDSTLWFINLEKVEYEFAQIEAKGIIIDKIKALQLISSHLDTKIDITYFDTLYPRVQDDKTVMSRISKVLRQLDERRQRYGGSLEEDADPFERLLEEDILAVLDQLAEEDKKAIIMKMVNGKTEYFELRDLFDGCFSPPPKMSERQFKIACYDLLMLLVEENEKICQTEQSFHEKYYKPGKETSYDWDKYRERVFTRIINKK